MNVVSLRVYQDPSLTPVVVIVDPQKEYLAEDRALYIEGAESAVANCRRAIGFAREQGFPVALTRWHQRGKFLADLNGFGGWLSGLEPRGSDMVFEKSMPSCYANPEFAEMMERGGGERAIIMGFAGLLACLSTIVDGYHRGHRFTYIADASASHPLRGAGAARAEDIAASVIGLYGTVLTTDAWIAAESAMLPMGGVAYDYRS